jgi:3'(2'), 5'-bisphosphate nucleotidase
MQSQLAALIDIAIAAGDATMPFYNQPSYLDVKIKSDHSPQTSADLAADAVLRHSLQALDPNVPILSEEAQIQDYAQRKTWSRYWLLDPLDGTRGFIRGSDEYTVNIALIENNEPVIGIIYQPPARQLFWAARGQGAFTGTFAAPQALRVRDFPPKPIVLSGLSLGSGQVQQFCERHNLTMQQVNSSLKLAYLAAGKADIYLRKGPTCEWDLAAGQCILEEAGGCLVDFNGIKMQYNRKQELLNGPFFALGDITKIDFILQMIKEEF